MEKLKLKLTQDKVLGYVYISINVTMKDLGIKIDDMAKVTRSSATATFTKAIIRMEKLKGKVCTDGLMEIFMKGNGKMDSKMVLDLVRVVKLIHIEVNGK